MCAIQQRRRRAQMSKCKHIGCANEVDTFYYCDDHFEEGEDND